MTTQQQVRIARELGIDRQLTQGGEAAEIVRRVDFIKQVLRESGCKALVLGISGGVDSLTAGRLCQMAVEQLRAEDHEARFIAVRLPYKAQADERDAQASLDFIRPDLTTTSNIADCVDGLMASISIDGLQPSADLTDFAKGNVKARARMLAQYAIANFNNGLVVGTDHGAEAVIGFLHQIRRRRLRPGSVIGLDQDPGAIAGWWFGCAAAPGAQGADGGLGRASAGQAR